MEPAQVLYACHGGMAAFKLSGVLRLNETGSFEESLRLNAAIERVAAEGFDSMVVDLSELEAIDSTHLGLVAHMGSLALERRAEKAVLVSVRPAITRLLRSMAMDSVFDIVERSETSPDYVPVAGSAGGDASGAAVTLKAHRALAALSRENNAAFSSLISLLERDENSHTGS